MPVIVDDSSVSTTSSTTVTVPTNTANHMLIGFTMAYSMSWQPGGGYPLPARGIPSGGGGTWYQAGDSAVFGATWEIMPYALKAQLYAWYSYPTQTGEVSLNTGSWTEGGGFLNYQYSSFISASNAEYDSVRVGEVGYDEAGETSLPAFYQRQGGRCFGVASASVHAQATGQGPVDGAQFLVNAELQNVFTSYVYFSTYHSRHRRNYSSTANKYWNQPGVDWDTTLYGAGVINVAVNTVECNL